LCFELGAPCGESLLRRVARMSEGMRTCGLLLLAITRSVTGETLLKQGMRGLGALDVSPAPLLPAFGRVFTPPSIALGVALIFGGSLFGLAAPSKGAAAWPIRPRASAISRACSWGRCSWTSRRRRCGSRVIVAGMYLAAT
jgi:hypothetical protein